MSNKYYWLQEKCHLVVQDTETGELHFYAEIMETEKQAAVAPKIVATNSKRPGARKCGACGKPGHRREKCGGSKNDEGGVALSEDTFLSIKAFQEDGMKSKAAAEDQGLPLIEVNKAYSELNYQAYLKNR